MNSDVFQIKVFKEDISFFMIRRGLLMLDLHLSYESLMGILLLFITTNKCFYINVQKETAKK